MFSLILIEKVKVICELFTDRDLVLLNFGQSEEKFMLKVLSSFVKFMAVFGILCSANVQAFTIENIQNISGHHYKISIKVESRQELLRLQENGGNPKVS